MKFDYFTMSIVFLVGMLVAWGESELCIGDKQATLLFVVTAVMFLCAAIGLGIKSPEYPRAQINARVAIVAALVITVAIDFGFSFFLFETASLVIPNGVILLLTALAVRKIFASRV